MLIVVVKNGISNTMNRVLNSKRNMSNYNVRIIIIISTGNPNIMSNADKLLIGKVISVQVV